MLDALLMSCLSHPNSSIVLMRVTPDLWLASTGRHRNSAETTNLRTP